MNYKVIVDAGHGGNDPGAIGNNLKEKDLNLRAALYIDKRLKELGIDSVLTRDSDISLPKDDRIRKIKSLTDKPQDTLLISNHINAGGGEGAEVVYSLKNAPTLANLVLSNIGDVGQKTRKIYQRRLPEDPNKDYYYILRESGVAEPLLIEYGFIDNINDSKRLNQEIEKYAESVVRAIAEYLGVAYSEILNDSDEYYIVQKGDTLYSISRRYGVSISDLKDINNLKSDVLSIGQKLFLKSRDNDIYVVQKGDSLWKIAKEYNISVQELIDLNKLNNLTLQIGQELIVPLINNNEVEKSEYIVQSGDTLWKIAKLYNISVDDLKLANNLSSNLLSIGQKLIIP